MQPLRRARRRRRLGTAAARRAALEQGQSRLGRAGRAIEAYHLEFKTSEVSPNGQYLAFMSEKSLTGYDNTDVIRARPATRRCSSTRRRRLRQLICVSCNPSGAQPTGVFDQLDSGEGAGAARRTARGSWAATLTENVGPLAGRQPAGLDRVRALRHQLPAALPDRPGPAVLQQQRLARVGATPTTARRTCTSSSPKASAAARRRTRAGGCIALISSGESERGIGVPRRERKRQRRVLPHLGEAGLARTPTTR